MSLCMDLPGDRTHVCMDASPEPDASRVRSEQTRGQHEPTAQLLRRQMGAAENPRRRLEVYPTLRPGVLFK